MVVSELAGVLDISDASVLVADDKVELTVLVPIERDGGDHLEVHGQRTRRPRQCLGFERSLPSRRTRPRGHSRRQGQPPSGGILGLGPRPDVLKIGETVQELAAQEIQVSVAVEVREIRRGPAEDLEVLAARPHTYGCLILGLRIGALIAHDIDETAQWPFDPFAFLVVSIVPTVVGPIADADDDVGLPVTVVVGIFPHVRADFVRVDVRRQRQLPAGLEPGLREIRVLDGRRQDPRLAIGALAELDVLHAFADAHARLEDRQRTLRRVGVGPEDIHAVRRLVGAVDDEFELAVAIDVHGQGPSPEADAKIHDEPRVVILQAFKTSLAG